MGLLLRHGGSESKIPAFTKPVRTKCAFSSALRRQPSFNPAMAASKSMAVSGHGHSVDAEIAGDPPKHYFESKGQIRVSGFSGYLRGKHVRRAESEPRWRFPNLLDMKAMLLIPKSLYSIRHDPPFSKISWHCQCTCAFLFIRSPRLDSHCTRQPFIF